MSSSLYCAAPTGGSRRALIRLGALAGVATAWVLQSMSLTPAHAETLGAPQIQATPRVEDRAMSRVGADHAQRGGSFEQRDDAPRVFAQTGLGLPVLPAIAFGAGTVALGVGAIALGARRRPSKQDEDEAPYQPGGKNVRLLRRRRRHRRPRHCT